MRKSKVKRVDPPPSDMVVGVGWYTPQEWARMKATAADSSVFEDSFAEWESAATENLEIARRLYPDASKVYIVADEFLAWRHLRGLTNNAETRAEFVAQKLRPTAPPAPPNPSEKD